ncbi:MAG: (Fe-S)-binding protein [Victivallales bacterium]|nr:(Fe-S)-binding protein [Victivallales bacterium]
MHIDNYIDTIRFCRFCFMCRHLSAIGNVAFTEADTPRVRASMIYGVTMFPERLANDDLIKTMYRSDLSGCCRRNCVNHYDEVGLTLAYRADLVEAGSAPEYIKVIAEELKNFGKWSVSGSGKVAYVADRYSVESGAAAAFAKLSKEDFQTVKGGSCGKGLWVLGFRNDAKILAEKFLTVLKETRAETIVVSHTGIYDFLVNTIGEMGLTLDAKVMHTSEYLADVKVSKAIGDVYYLESDYLRNYNDDYPYPKAVLVANGANLRQFGTNDEESYSCAEGALVLDKIEPELVRKLAEYIEARADNPASDVIVTASPYTKLQLAKYTSLNVKTIEELLADAL